LKNRRDAGPAEWNDERRIRRVADECDASEKVLAEAGANPTLKEAEPPGATESGKASPEVLNPVPAREACVTLRVAVPGFRMVSVCVLVTPTVTLPKLMLVGITVICGCTPVPLRETTAGEFVCRADHADVPRYRSGS